MINEKETHLNEKEITRAVVDEADLPAHLQKHLSTCNFCRAEKERFERQLSQLGRMAKRLAPPHKRRVTLTAQRTSRDPWFRTWRFPGLLAACVSAVMVIAVMWWTTPVTTSLEDSQARLTRETLQDEQFLSEISWLEEHAISLIYFDISGESMPGISEEFMEFVIPAIQDEPTYHEMTKEVYYVA